MPLQINSPGWRIQGGRPARGARARAAVDLPGLPPEFLTDESSVAEEVVLEPAQPTRTREAVDASASGLDITYDLEPGQTAVLAIRLPSGALTFHLPVQSTRRSLRGPSQVRFQVTVRRAATRGLVGQAIKAIVIKVAQVAADQAVSFVLPRLAEALEKAVWKRRGLKEGWLRVTQETLAAGVLESAKPISADRSLLLLHGTFSNAASAYADLARSKVFDRLKDTYADRVFAFDHFTVSRTPEQNALMLLEGLPAHPTTFDVVTHSRGGLVLRSLVERTSQLGDLSRRFKLGRAVLVASPNEGTPLATPKRWDETLGWMANLLEVFPDNPFTTGAAFVANGLVWLANHASGDLPGLHAMDGDGEVIAAMQGPPGPPAGAYSALVANFHPTGATLQRLIDVGVDQFFGSANDLVVPSEGGWRVDRSVTGFVPASRIGCFGPGGNLPPDTVTHLNFFSQPETVDFLVNALLGRPQPLNGVDPRKALPDHHLLRGAITDGPGIARKGKAPVGPRPGSAESRPKAEDEAPLRITVTNGDLTFEPEALLLGHYRATRLTGTEAVMNRLIGGAMAHSLQVGVYPLTVGTNQIFINTRPDFERGAFMPRPKAVIVVGMGEEGKLRSADLAHSVRQAVIAWAQRLAEQRRRGESAFFELAATLIGSGGTGVSAGEAARLIAQGVYDANVLLKAAHAEDAEWPRVRHLHLIELYLDRATEAWRALRLQEAATPGRYEVGDVVQMGIGALQRPSDSGYRGTGYDFITVELKEEKEGEPVISYTLDTRRARSEVRGQRTQSALLRDLVATASNDQNRDQQVGRTLFSLLIPLELEAYMASSGEMQIELVPGTAGIPWELLDTTSDIDLDQHPWAIRVKLLRKLRVERVREQVIDADADACVLVIGEPECPKEFPRLPGARAEAIAVRNRLTQPDALDPGLVTGLLAADPSEPGANARTVVNALFERPWRIVHIAGHGMVASGGKPGGVVLSNGTFLGPGEINNMRAVPELVFVNCCHLAGGDADQLLRYDRAEFASGVAEALIRIGVRCVIAAGWAVDDDSASLFADTFYGSLLRGNRFIDAVGEARATTYEQTPNVNTWAAYQCYGDPDWVFRRGAPDPNQHTPSADDFSGVASATSLRLALEQIIVQTKFQGADVATQLLNLQKLEKLFGDTWGKSGAVAELFGEAFVEAGALESGMHWYERAVAAPDGRASVKAAEQLANVRCRLGWEIVDQARRHHESVARQERASGRGKNRVTARRAQEAARRSLNKAVERADELIEQALALLMKLRALGETLERESLIGSVFKRRALVNSAGGRRDRVRQDLQEMKSRYRHARVVGAKGGASDLYYPASNCLAADVALNAGTRRWRSLDRDDREIVDQTLKARNKDDADFWSVAGDVELRVYEALARRRLASERKQIDKAYQDLHDRVKATRMWASVYDTAYLVLQNYAERVSGKEKTAALELLGGLRLFAHPEAEQ